MKKIISRQMTEAERKFCLFAAALPEEHDERGCPISSYHVYAKIAELSKGEVADEFWRASYDDGRSCPMFSVIHLAKELLEQDEDYV